MKLFDVRWANVLRDLPRWTALPLPARRILLDELKPNGYVQATRFGVQRDVIIGSGIPLVDAGQTRLWVGDERRELVKVLRAMGRHPIFDAPATPALVRYMEEHFTNVEIEVLGSHGHAGGGYANRHTLALRVAFAGWVSDFLDADRDTALAAWATARGVRSGDASNFTLRNLQRLSRKLLNFPDGLPLRELVAPLAEDDANDLANALSVGLGTMIVFAGMRHRDLEPMVGLWPGIAHELTRAPVQPPTAVAPVEHFALAIQMEDMTTLLAAIVAAPVRLRADDLAVFARTRVSVESRLVPVPMWSAQLLSSPHFTRVDGAAGELRKYGFVQVRDVHGNPHLEALPAGARWLTLSPHDRLAALIDPLRASTDLNPPGAYQTARAIRFFPFSLAYVEAPKSLRLRDSLTKAFLGAASGFVPLEAFLDHASREGNPLQPMPASVGRDPYGLMYYGDRGDPREVYRGMWRGMLQQFLVHRLIGLGGANIGRLASGALCFSLTDAGRYLFGAADGFAYGARDAGDVVIQPNFDVVFLGTAPSIEATLARFAERVGVAPGLTFRITRKSVLGAAEVGATAAEVLGELSRASSKPVPKNVEREIAGWMASVRRARLRIAQLIECADEEAAARIVTLLGAKARRLTATVFEFSAATPSARAAILKKLRGGGVFIEDTTGRVAEQPARVPRVTRRRRRTVDPDDYFDDDDDDF